MAGSNYPPGVTGNEPEIAGYDDDEAPRDDEHTCPTCGRYLAWHWHAGAYCPMCASAEFMLSLDALDEQEAERRQRANWNATADGLWPPYPSEY